MGNHGLGAEIIVLANVRQTRRVDAYFNNVAAIMELGPDLAAFYIEKMPNMMAAVWALTLKPWGINFPADEPPDSSLLPPAPQNPPRHGLRLVKG
jgi:hypothetical protein